MSRSSRKKKSPKSKAPPKAPRRARPYWTLLLWLLVIAGLLVFQTRRLTRQQHEKVESELQRLEKQYEGRLNELQMQVNLLESELGLNDEPDNTKKPPR